MSAELRARSNQSANARTKLAAQQIALMQALTSHTSLSGFDLERLQATAISLQQKRRRTVEHMHPCIASALGDRFVELFDEYAELYSTPAAGPRADAIRFTEYLAKCDLLPDHLWRGYFLSSGWKHPRNWWLSFLYHAR